MTARERAASLARVALLTLIGTVAGVAAGYIPAMVGYFVGGVLAPIVASGSSSFGAAHVVGQVAWMAGAGAVVGALQWLELRRWFAFGRWWIAASALAWGALHALTIAMRDLSNIDATLSWAVGISLFASVVVVVGGWMRRTTARQSAERPAAPGG